MKTAHVIGRRPLQSLIERDPLGRLERAIAHGIVTAQVVADTLRVPVGRLAKWQYGSAVPSQRTLTLIADLLDMLGA